MSGIAIYIEGGGDGKDGKAALRLGFDALLKSQKERARERRLSWRVVLCGGRNATFDAFRHAAMNAKSETIVMLVDSEGQVQDPTPRGRVDHLRNQDAWDLRGIHPDRVHLMTQCMEAWIIADTEALAGFYGHSFHAPSLPKRQVLDDEPKASIYSALENATRNTQKGSYGKIKHASEVLKLVRPSRIAARCLSFREFSDWLDGATAEA